MVDEEARYRTLGELIRRQRELAELPMRQFAAMVGISNPYLSQIERNLREPSERVLDAIAEHLQMSTDMLLGQLRNEPRAVSGVVTAIDRDPDLTNAQRKALTEMYEAFREVTRGKRKRGRPAAGDDSNVDD
ncbi:MULTISPECIES: helix-turn-helix domain-containing protein [unclassified Rhodococcus (in: high G+C Gram-positive bacteria)]|uniref:helix-turn-helix domain-containing protein n=1 Tax=unclassified Rhodococcus (in: high G+C Gram-positive bacteria) TaxID=192944 RepID=UPI00163A4294|nr:MULTISPECIES: helix-turn-helix transcriptional regulator [unclassified Rhodococcus (in: high G+C Gram-positive bacteria)]MBC2641298.1 helix-turn-helix transcriptional regulator [Rhodococcus sp. 3A]MBC2893957.1 helix-turn-helix transcriptional regulator [Rhodococcus sp. 4CII]